MYANFVHSNLMEEFVFLLRETYLDNCNLLCELSAQFKLDNNTLKYYIRCRLKLVLIFGELRNNLDGDQL